MPRELNIFLIVVMMILVAEAAVRKEESLLARLTKQLG